MLIIGGKKVLSFLMDTLYCMYFVVHQLWPPFHSVH